MTEDRDLRVVGVGASPCTRKLRAALRYRRLPFRFVLAESKEAQALPDRPLPLVPYLIASAMLRDAWERRTATTRARADALASETRRIEQKVGRMLDRIFDTESVTLIQAYEDKVRSLERKRIAIGEKLAGEPGPRRTFEETYRTAMTFLGNPYNLWACGDLDGKRAVLRLTFAEKLRHHRNEGYRTAKTTLPFKVLGGLSPLRAAMVGPEGLEPPT